MKRFAAVAAAATLLGLAGGALAAPTYYGVPPIVRVQDPPSDPSRWTEPAGSFSVERPAEFTDIDTASLPLAPVLQIIISSKSAECWFTRIPRERTAALSPSDLIVARSKPLDNAMWTAIGANQHLLQGKASVVEAQVENINGWPVQTAWLRGAAGDVYAALHSRPGLDVWAFCAAIDGKDRSAQLLRIARSVATPNDAAWARMMKPQASFTAVP